MLLEFYLKNVLLFVVFNGVIQLCVTHLPTAFEEYLKCDPKLDEIHKSKRFKKIRGILKSYLADLIKVCIFL